MAKYQNTTNHLTTISYRAQPGKDSKCITKTHRMDSFTDLLLRQEFTRSNRLEHLSLMELHR